LRERQQSGVGRGVDLEQANGRLALAQTNLMTESNNLNDVTQRYRRVIGEYPGGRSGSGAEYHGTAANAGTTQFVESCAATPACCPSRRWCRPPRRVRNRPRARALRWWNCALAWGATAPAGRHLPRHETANVQVLMTYNLYRGGADEARVRQTIAQGYAARDVAITPAATSSRSCRCRGTTSRVCASNCLSCVSTGCPPAR
jgi:adhesin transport system outer membrane protein